MNATVQWHIRERWRAGESVASLAANYDLPLAEVQAEIDAFARAIEARNAVPQGAPPVEPPQSGYICQSCGAQSFGSVTPTLFSGIYLLRCSKQGIRTPHQKVPDRPLSQTPVSLEGKGQARRSDPPTSKAAADRIRTGSAKRALLLAHADHREGLTDEEAADWARLSKTSEYATRCSELMRAGYLRDTAETRPGESGMRRVVRQITESGLRAIGR